jgi:2-amino-4-hydroxy-6-hydroxymethyldihydropteridine diphosphokinase
VTSYQYSAISGESKRSATSDLDGQASIERVFIAFGSNLGDRAEWLQKAREKLSEATAVKMIRASAIYETAPVGKIDQPAFLNQVVEVRTTVGPENLLTRLLQIEQELGRQRQERWGPRNIDLDLLAYGECQIQNERLKLPHPELPRRRFVLAPWAEIAPEFEVVGLNATVKALLQCCNDHGRVQKL